MRKLVLGLIVLAAATVPQAASADATVRVIHAISGTALGLPATLPVDIWVNGAPFLTEVEFLDYTDPVMLPAGQYDVEIYLAGSDPMVDSPVLAQTFDLTDGLDAHLVAHFTPGPGIALSAFVNNAAPVVTDPLSHRVAARDLRVTVRHAADFPRAQLNRLLPGADPTLANGEGLTVDANAGTYRFWLGYAGAQRPLSVEPTATFDLAAGAHYYVYAVGSPADGSFQLLVIGDPLM